MSAPGDEAGQVGRFAASAAEVDAGQIAFCAPAPTKPKRQRLSAPAAAAADDQARPSWAPQEREAARKGLSAHEKRLTCKARQSVASLVASGDGPLLRNEAWFSENRGGPVRKIVATLCGVGATTAGSAWREMNEGGGVLRAAVERGPKRKAASAIAMKGATPGGATLYDVVKERIEDCHKRGFVTTATNLLRYVTLDPAGPQLPSVCPRVFRRKLQQMGLTRARTRKVIVAARAAPYVAQWRKAYCERRVADLSVDGAPKRPRVWLDATFVNRRASGAFTWVAPGSASEFGSATEDANRGGKGERWAILHAFADWADKDGTRHAQFLPDALKMTRGLAVDNEIFLPWFQELNVAANKMFPRKKVAFRLDNSRIHLFSKDFNAADSRHSRATLLARALEVGEEYVDGAGAVEGLRESLESGAKKELVAFLQDVAGPRVPEIFKIARQYNNAVERTPPYRPEVQPIEFIWAHGKTAYATRYEGGQGRGVYEGLLR